jgi:hypothetical protein
MKKQLIAILVFLTLVITGFAIITPISAVSNSVSKTFDVDNGELGDVVGVTVDITVLPGYSAWFYDWLPSELKYIGNFEIDGVPATPTSYDDHSVGYYWLTEGTYTITFDVKVVEATSWEELEVYNYGWVRWYYDSTYDTGYFDGMFTIEPFEELTKYVDEALEAEVGADTHWTMHIELNDVPFDMYDVVITDRFGGDIEVDEVLYYDGSEPDLTKKKGKTQKQFMTWDVGDLLITESAELILDISTDMNTGNGNGNNPNFPAGHQEYTEEGWHDLNSGATLKFYDAEVDGDRLSAYTDSIEVYAYYD